MVYCKITFLWTNMGANFTSQVRCSRCCERFQLKFAPEFVKTSWHGLVTDKLQSRPGGSGSRSKFKVIDDVKVKGQGRRAMTDICIYIVNNSVFAVPLVFCPTSVIPNSNLPPISDIIALAFSICEPQFLKKTQRRLESHAKFVSTFSQFLQWYFA